jgi:hypothetical protein
VVLSAVVSMIALFSAAHQGNTAATTVDERISFASGDSWANAVQEPRSVSWPGRTSTVVHTLRAILSIRLLRCRGRVRAGGAHTEQVQQRRQFADVRPGQVGKVR